eukprot:sb/3473413/
MAVEVGARGQVADSLTRAQAGSSGSWQLGIEYKSNGGLKLSRLLGRLTLYLVYPYRIKVPKGVRFTADEFDLSLSFWPSVHGYHLSGRRVSAFPRRCSRSLGVLYTVSGRFRWSKTLRPPVKMHYENLDHCKNTSNYKRRGRERKRERERE